MSGDVELVACLLEPLAPRDVLLLGEVAGNGVGRAVATWCRDHGVPQRDGTDDPAGWPAQADLVVATRDTATTSAEPLRDRLLASGQPSVLWVVECEDGHPVSEELCWGEELACLQLPVLDGLTYVASRDATEDLGPGWPSSGLDGPLGAMLATLERARHHDARHLANLRRELEELTVSQQRDRRAVERLDREVAHLRREAREAAILRRQLEALQRDHDRLRDRRSVRAVLSLAEYARPLFQLRRGQLDWKPRRQRPRLQTGSEHEVSRPRRTVHHFQSTDVGTFYEWVRPLVESHREDIEFIDRWATSEEALRQRGPLSTPEDAPLVSVVMPTHNRAHLLREAISSVTDQTFVNWELLVCDDASEDDTGRVVAGFDDERIRHLRLPRGGAARARNAGLAEAHGELVAYLDSDNLWHPRFLEVMVGELERRPGRHSAYASYLDVVVDGTTVELKKAAALPFDYERLSRKNFVDLNSFVHRRELYDAFGGFNEELVRQQDWDLILRYTFLADPFHVDRLLALYRRNREWGQITDVHADDRRPTAIIEETIAALHRDGLPRRAGAPAPPRLTIVSWDICRNHFSKAYNLAEAMEQPDRVELVGFRFFDDPIFPPYATASPRFEHRYLEGGELPGWSDQLARGVAAVHGDVVYAVKPRLPSLGLALLANRAFGTPVVLEMNDLESVVQRPEAGQAAEAVSLADADPADPRLLDPYGTLWTAIMEGLAPQVPWRATHNRNLDEHFGGGAFQMRNPKDDRRFDPDRYDREEVRRELGYGPDDRVLLFGGMVRRHKGVFRYAELLEHAGPEYRLLVVGSRETPDQRRFRDEVVGSRVRILDPLDRNEMARINLACDAVVLWLDPDVPASHYQMPYKLTDALAMRVPVLANPIGELADLGRAGYLRLVPFGDDAELVAALEDVVADHLATDRMVDAGRRLYLRQFSYRAVRSTVDLLLDAAGQRSGPLPVAEQFADFFARFRAAQPQGRVLPGRGGS